MPFTPTRKVTLGPSIGGAGVGLVGDGSFENGAELSLEQTPATRRRLRWPGGGRGRAERPGWPWWSARPGRWSAAPFQGLPASASSTVRVRATMVSILVDSVSRVRETACFMRLKKPDLAVSGGADPASPGNRSLGLPKGYFCRRRTASWRVPDSSLEHSDAATPRGLGGYRVSEGVRRGQAPSFAQSSRR